MISKQDRLDLIARIVAVETFKKKRLLDHDIPRNRQLLEDVLDVRVDGTPIAEEIIRRANSEMILYLINRYG